MHTKTYFYKAKDGTPRKTIISYYKRAEKMKYDNKVIAELLKLMIDQTAGKCAEKNKMNRDERFGALLMVNYQFKRAGAILEKYRITL
jgi:hypothetical protein